MSKRFDALLFRREQLKRLITQCLDLLLQGSLHQNPSQRGFHLTTKVQQRTVTKYVRKELVPRARLMTQNHRRLHQHLARLSDVNWRLLQLPPED